VEGKMRAELQRLQARSVALNRRLEDLRDRRDRGRIDEGRYADLATDLDRERIETLIQLRTLLQNADEEISYIVEDAIRGDPEGEVMDRLAVAAEEKQLGPRIVEGLRKHRGHAGVMVG
jgi:hypothetical protein